VPKFRLSGAKLRSAREAAGLTREQVAALIHRSEAAVCVYELDYRQPPPVKLVELAHVYGCRVEDFFDITEEVPA
jgi:transcriptional regulator with XRE-family HTH domain